MFYQANKIASRTRTTDPSLTDQSAAPSTDLNIILKGQKLGQPVMGRGAASAPAYEDYTNTPADLRDAIELARQLPDAIGRLPKELRGIPLNQVLALQPDELARILTPAPAPTPEPKKEDEK